MSKVLSVDESTIDNIEFGVLDDDFVKVSKWVRTLRRQIKYSSFFVLAGNIYDYADFKGKQFLKEFLIDYFQDRFKHIWKYDIADNLQFVKGKEKDFFTLADMKKRELTKSERDAGLQAPELSLPTKPFDVFTSLEKTFKNAKSDQKIMVIVEFSDKLEMDEDNRLAVRFHKLANNPDFQEKGHVVILLAPSVYDLPRDLQTGIEGIRLINIPEPDEMVRYEFIEQLDLDVLPKDFDRNDLEKLVSITRGLSLIDIRTIILENDRGSLSNLFTLIEERVRSIIDKSSEGSVKTESSKVTFSDVKGIDAIVHQVKKNLDYMLAGKYLFVHQGLGFFGSPGLGKSYLLKAMSNYLGVRLFVLDGIFNKYVGESERLVKKAIAIVKRFGGILAIDEMDQTGKRGEEGDSGVASRIFKEIMVFMSEEEYRGIALVVVASNRPDLIDAAFKRLGRLSLIIPFLKPAQKARREMLEGMCQGLEIVVANDVCFKSLAKRLVGYTPADFKELLTKLKERLYVSGKEKADSKDFDWIIQSYPLASLDCKKEALMEYATLCSVNDLPIILGEDFDYSDEALFALEKDSDIYEEICHVLNIYDNAVKVLFVESSMSVPVAPQYIRTLEEIRNKIESDGINNLEVRSIET